MAKAMSDTQKGKKSVVKAVYEPITILQMCQSAPDVFRIGSQLMGEKRLGFVGEFKALCAKVLA